MYKPLCVIDQRIQNEKPSFTGMSLISPLKCYLVGYPKGILAVKQYAGGHDSLVVDEVL